MDNQNKDLHDEPFSPDPEENLRIENELLKLKLQAERGAFFSESRGSIPAETEAAFLQHIEQFEAAYEQAKETTVYEFIGKPDCKKAEALEPKDQQDALDGMLEMLEEKNIILEVIGEYPPAVIYEFITGEFFRHTFMPISVPGFMHCFTYEEFHPNHALSIERTANEFLDHWFQKEFSEYSVELADTFITADGRQLTREEIMTRLSNCLDSYRSFSNSSISDTATSFEWNEAENTGLGHAEGMISYDATLENGETVHFSGPYKLYLCCVYDYWQIFYFVMPGFEW